MFLRDLEKNFFAKNGKKIAARKNKIIEIQ